MKFDENYFSSLRFTKEQIKVNLNNALRNLEIAEKDNFLEVKFNYPYTALIKAGIALLSFYGIKLRSVPGHHAKLIEETARILKDDSISDIGNAMRLKRNKDLYAGGILVTEKDCGEYIDFVSEVLKKVERIIK